LPNNLDFIFIFNFLRIGKYCILQNRIVVPRIHLDFYCCYCVCFVFEAGVSIHSLVWP
jgi:hypothetical protein